MTYPNSPGYAKYSDTSREAADRLTSKDELQGFILNYLQQSCIYSGSTVDEAKERCESHFERTFDRSTIAARFTELTEAGQIVLTSEKRLTPRRRKAGVYLHRDFAPVGSLERQARGSAKMLQKQVTELSLLVYRLARQLPEDNRARQQALDYIKRHELGGSPLREDSNA